MKNSGFAARQWLRRLALTAVLSVVLASLNAPPAISIAPAAPSEVAVAITEVILTPGLTSRPLKFVVVVTPVAPGAGIPSGQVEVRTDLASICLITLDSAGKGSCETVITQSGNYTFRALYFGSTSFLPGLSQDYELEVVFQAFLGLVVR